MELLVSDTSASWLAYVGMIRKFVRRRTRPVRPGGRQNLTVNYLVPVGGNIARMTGSSTMVPHYRGVKSYRYR